MNEGFSVNYENNQKNKEGQNPSLLSPENQVREQYLKYKTIDGSRELATAQIKENQDLKNGLETQVHNETKEDLDKEAMINEAKTMLYEKLGIDNDQNNNSALVNFEKGIIDTLILDNYDLAIQVWETNGKILIDSLKQLASWEGLKKMAESLGESIWNLLSGNAYERGKSVAELGLITTGVGVGAYIGKKGFKLGMKEIARLRKPAERVVESSEVKGVIGQVNNRVNEIVPKNQLDFEKALVEDIVKLRDKERLEAASFYLKKKLTPEQEKAIIEAHNVGINREGAGIYNYNQAEITEKARILKGAGFNKEERKILLEKGVCGKEKSEYRKIFDSLPENIKNLNLELSNYSPQQLEGIKMRLGLDSKATIDDIDLAYRLKLKDVLERYKKLSDVNLARFEGEILEHLRKSGDADPVQTLESEILKLEVMKDRGELLVVSAMLDEVVGAGIKFNHFANLDRIGYNDFRSPLGTKEGNLQYRIDRNYNELRSVTDNVMGVEGLDPTYLSLVISKNDIHNLSQYGDNFMVFGVDELHGRATITMNDSMLAGRFNGNLLDTQLIHYSTETLIKAKAIYNIDERLGFPIFNRMRGEAFRENQRMRFFYEEMKPFIEVQVYGKTSDRIKESLSVDDIMKKFNN